MKTFRTRDYEKFERNMHKCSVTNVGSLSNTESLTTMFKSI